MDNCNLVKVSRDFMRAPDRGRVVAHAYHDDAVIAICRQKRDARRGYGAGLGP